MITSHLYWRLLLKSILEGNDCVYLLRGKPGNITIKNGAADSFARDKNTESCLFCIGKVGLYPAKGQSDQLKTSSFLN